MPNENKRVNFVKKNLGCYNNDFSTNLHEYMRDYSDIFMKLDIEGHEFRIFPTFWENNYMNKVKQLIVEIHSPADIQLFPDYFKGLSDIKDEHMFELFKNLNKTHTLVHFHANNGCKMNMIHGIKIPHVFELTYIRNDFVTEKLQNDKPLPTELDMKNVAGKEDYILSGFPYSL